MRILLDSHLVLWAAADDPRMSAEARDAIENPANDVYFSAASIWDMAIKSALRRKDFRVDVSALRASLPARGFTELAVTGHHAAATLRLPAIHRDPFDRLLVSQSLIEPMILLTSDQTLSAYGPTVRVV